MSAHKFLPLENILKFEYPIYAHTHETKNRETLQEHTRLCQTYYEQLYHEKRLGDFFCRFAERFLLKQCEPVYKIFHNMIDNVVTFHDVGKVNPEFQRVNMNHYTDKVYWCDWFDGTRHSLFSAYAYVNFYMKKINELVAEKTAKKILWGICLINGMVISRHHSDLTRMGDFIDEFKPGGKIQLMETGLRKSGHFLYLDIDLKRDKYWNRWNRFKQFTDQNKELEAGAFLYTRMLYSLLVSCDYYATTEYGNDYCIKDFGNVTRQDEFCHAYENTELIRMIRKKAADQPERLDFSSIKDINQLRTVLFLEAEQTMQQNLHAPVYFLEAPTGSGKSNTAMNLSFQLLQQGYQKIYYVYPFNTLVEQNINILKETFGEDSNEFDRIAVINSNTPIKCKQINDQEILDDYVKALLDRQFLNYPFILTTHVSLFQTMFSHEREALFGFLQLKDSIIILDEIQSYKNTIWSEIIIFLKNFAAYLNIKIIIMSATLPDLNYLCDDGTDVVSLVHETERYFSNCKFKDRVRVSYELLGQNIRLEVLLQHILSKYDGQKKIVVEFIKRKTAYEFARMIKDQNNALELILFTGDDNRADRLKKIQRIKNSKDGLLLIATQVVEAGVDIDMDIGYKNVSKLDSEEQFLGRINRSCKKLAGGKVYFFDHDDAAAIYKDGDCRISPELTLKDETMRELLKDKRFSPYYLAVMEHIRIHRNQSGDSTENIDVFFDEKVGGLNFTDISKRMALIDDDKWTKSVFLSREIEVDNGTLKGDEVWEQYRLLLEDYEMDYSKKQVKLSKVRSKLNYFIYEISKHVPLDYNDQIGELYKIDNGDTYFIDDIFQRDKLEEGERFL
ncbi:MAG: CRISPR-associated helicase Cas3' [Lachnospiraceae bacterium]